MFRILLCVTALLSAHQTAARDISGVIRVIDGDTIDVGDTRIRLHGIDAPERDQPCFLEGSGEWACGIWVTAEVRERFEDRNAQCVALDVDRYDRVVARCFVAGEDMARVLVQEGLAFAYRKYSLDYDLDEKGAAIQGIGLHGSRVQAPAAFRQRQPASNTVPASGCVIKGNISSTGTRIYHRPGQRDYEKTRISTSKGERWFCSEKEAQAAGWRAARR